MITTNAIALLILVVLSANACANDDEITRGTADASHAGHDAQAGGATNNLGGAGGSTAGGLATAAGTAGQRCGLSACDGLDEAACAASRPRDGESGCFPAWGVPYAADAEVPDEYAGCARLCCGDDCPTYPDTQVCATDPNGGCWTLNAQPVPDGWTVLSETLACYEIAECGE